MKPEVQQEEKNGVALKGVQGGGENEAESRYDRQQPIHGAR